MCLDSRLNVFLGDNGKGKSSVLNAIAIALSRIYPFCDYLPKIAPLPYSFENVRQQNVSVSVRGRSRTRQEYAETSGIECVLNIEKTQGEENKVESALLAVEARRANGKGVVSYTVRPSIGMLFKDELLACGSIPVFAQYGPHRGATQGERKRFSRKKLNYGNPFAAYVNSLQPSLDFDAFLDWFNEEEASELREQRHDRSYVSRELQCVRDALVRVFESSEMQMSTPRFETNPKRFVMTSRNRRGEEVELQFDQLSDGYRGMVALVADFARRLAIANLDSDTNPLDGDGVLMIDEIDAHLHPKWQYRVISDLQRTFPNVQLIVTTHSAEVVSMVDRKNVYILDTDNGMLEDRHPVRQTDGSFPEEIASEVMGAPDHVHVHPAYRAFTECLYLIQSGREDSSEFKVVLNDVLGHYGENHPFAQEIQARVEGAKRRRAMLSRLRKEEK